MKTMAERLNETAPYNIFFTTICDLPETFTQDNVINFSDLLSPSLGKLKNSLQLNCRIKIDWLMQQYEQMGHGQKPLTVLYGDEGCYTEEDAEIILKYPNVAVQFIKTKTEYGLMGLHHSKVGIFLYDDNSLRIVVSTANLYFEDWNIHCNGLWISPLCPTLPETSSDKTGAGTAYFKPTLLSYLSHYEEPLLKDWIDYVKRADFSAVKVCLVTSVPGLHKSTDWPMQCHLHRVGELLSLHCKLPSSASRCAERPPKNVENETTSSKHKLVADDINLLEKNEEKTNNKSDKAVQGKTRDEALSWEILTQASSIGYLGNSPNNWLRTVLLQSLASHTHCRLPAKSEATIKIVYPTINDALNGHYDPAYGASCLYFWMDVSQKNQSWPKRFLHSWKADCTGRSKAMPHIKTYCRISPCTSKLAWFLLTSANISKSAWGSRINRDGSILVRSYEVGVLFLPKYFNETHFQIKKDSAVETKKLFPFIYDVPLSPYGAEDEPPTHLAKLADFDEEENLNESYKE